MSTDPQVHADDEMVFGRYADFYDAFYAGKDYEAECDYITATLDSFGVGPGARLLDLGAGTGGHDIPLSRRGFDVVGVDRSDRMVAAARKKATDAEVHVEFVLGDVRDVRVAGGFDAVISMFAVISYQLTNADLLGMLETARAHLAPGGLFVFDGWFGPAVLSERPEDRSRTVIDAAGDSITRDAHPTLDPVAQTVEVAYTVTRESSGAVVETTHEAHRMRFLFAQELDLLLGVAGFELVAFGPFMRPESPITIDDWNFSAIARAVAR